MHYIHTCCSKQYIFQQILNILFFIVKNDENFMLTYSWVPSAACNVMLITQKFSVRVCLMALEYVIRKPCKKAFWINWWATGVDPNHRRTTAWFDTWKWNHATYIYLTNANVAPNLREHIINYLYVTRQSHIRIERICKHIKGLFHVNSYII